jgi:hypothetical protein
MEGLRDLWNNHKALLITGLVVLAAILIYIYEQNKGNGIGTAVAPGTGVSQTPDASTEQLSAILADLGQLTPVTNTLQPINTVTNNTTTITNPTLVPPTLTTTLTTPPVTTTVTNTNTVTAISGIGNDTARDAAIKAAEQKYKGPSQAAALQQAIAAIQKQYPRSGPTT